MSIDWADCAAREIRDRADAVGEISTADVAAILRREIDRAVAEEREACELVVLRLRDKERERETRLAYDALDNAAAAIRARKP